MRIKHAIKLNQMPILRLYFIVLCLIAGTIISSAQELPRNINNGFTVSVGDEAPHIQLTMTDGDTIDSDFLKGQVVLLQFMATWCPISFAETPYIEKNIWERFKNNSLFTVIAVDVNTDGNTDKLKEFIEKTGATYTFAIDNDGDVFSQYAHRSAGVTRNILIDADGKIAMVTRKFKKRDFKKLANKIEELLTRTERQ